MDDSWCLEALGSWEVSQYLGQDQLREVSARSKKILSQVEKLALSPLPGTQIPCEAVPCGESFWVKESDHMSL